mgnify:CR=1 FL=1
MGNERTVFRTCPLCEAGCGLAVTVVDGVVTRIRGDRDDVFSKGFLCPKGSSLKQLHDDPDRLRRPLVKRDGVHVEVSWDEAWSVIADRLPALIAAHGPESVGVYLGNPSAHNLGAMLYNRTLLGALRNRRRFSASTVDQAPRQVASGFVFGSPVAVPVPDLDHTDHLVVIGANPYASNGSMCTAPDFPGRIERMRERGGRLVVVDPRRSRTAEEADLWLPIRPGTDALFLAAMVTAINEAELVNVGDHVGAWLDGLPEVLDALARFTPESVAEATGIDAATTRAVALDLARAASGSVYGRIGTTTTEFGTLASWLIDVVNIVTGNLDQRGGAMFAMPVAGGATTRGQRGVGGDAGRHQPGVALAEHALHVVGVHVRVADSDVVGLADGDDVGHCSPQVGVVVLPGDAHLLREVALADEHGADARHLFEDLGQVLDGPQLLAHDDAHHLAVRRQRPDVGPGVVLLLRHAPVARGGNRRVAAVTGGFVGGRGLRLRVAA